MKYILTTLLICVSSFCFSQDTLHIPSPELEEFFLALDTLEVQDSIKTLLIKQLEYEILIHEKIAEQDSLIISYKDQEILLLLVYYAIYRLGLDDLNVNQFAHSIGEFLGPYKK